MTTRAWLSLCCCTLQVESIKNTLLLHGNKTSQLLKVRAGPECLP